MPVPGSTLWERLSALGAGEPSPGERRRIRLTNQSAMIGALSCGSFAVGYAIAGPRYWAPMLANIVAVAFLVAALFANRARAHTLAKICVLLPVNLVVVVATMLLGGRVGFLYYFFLFAAVAFLLFSEKEPWPRAFFAVFSGVSCVVARLAAPGDDEVLVVLTPGAEKTLDLVSALAVVATVIFIVHLFTGDTARAEAQLAEEHARSERLLLNILPAPISVRLKDQGEAIADGFAEVTVLFADIVGFTELSQTLSPEELVRMLNRIFTEFDDIAEKLGIEKIKTIGDCYMVAAGLPERRADHAEAIAQMALRIREALDVLNRAHGYSLRLRMGIHTGPVVAGVIGKRKFIYDLWGDTVNTASRMESNGLPGEIQVTREAHDRLATRFELTPRGPIAVKGKGTMETFLLLRERTML